MNRDFTSTKVSKDLQRKTRLDTRNHFQPPTFGQTYGLRSNSPYLSCAGTTFRHLKRRSRATAVINQRASRNHHYLRHLELPQPPTLYRMEDDSMNFGSDAAGATPGSNSILAQPPLAQETSPPGQQEAEGQTAEGMRSQHLWHAYG